MDPNTVLVVMCRRPALGVGKQRLAHSVGAEAALAIAERLLACTLEDAAVWPHALVLAPAEANDGTWARTRLQRPLQVIAQTAGNLGERINAIDAALRAQGAQRLLFIGTDAPALSLPDLLAAARALDVQGDDCDTALAAAEDGGVTLMASRRPWPPLGQLPWSTAQLGMALQQACGALGRRVAALPPGFDIDNAADLPRALLALQDDARVARRELCATIRSLT